MTFRSICRCPWAQAAKLAGTIPRVLADDLMAFVAGEDAHIKTAGALILAHEFILDLRGKVKVEKHGLLPPTLCSVKLCGGSDLRTTQDLAKLFMNTGN